MAESIIAVALVAMGGTALLAIGAFLAFVVRLEGERQAALSRGEGFDEESAKERILEEIFEAQIFSSGPFGPTTPVR